MLPQTKQNRKFDQRGGSAGSQIEEHAGDVGRAYE